MTSHCMVLCTCPNQATADTIAREIVQQRLAACVNLIPAVTSYYQWDGELQRDSECQLVIKTLVEVEPKLKQAVFSLHPYDVPEWLILSLSGGDNNYLDWIKSSLT